MLTGKVKRCTACDIIPNQPMFKISFGDIAAGAAVRVLKKGKTSEKNLGHFVKKILD
jgi:hypothetical protein